MRIMLNDISKRVFLYENLIKFCYYYIPLNSDFVKMRFFKNNKLDFIKYTRLRIINKKNQLSILRKIEKKRESCS
jgi:hypothetical protein